MTLELDSGEDVRDVILVYDPTAGLTISGRVTDTLGQPMADARLSCRGPISAQEVARTRTTTVTDQRGYYMLEGLAEGTYSLTVNHGDHQYLDSYQVEAGAWNVDFEFQRRQTSMISGRVVRADTGEPITSFRHRFKMGIYDIVDENAPIYTDFLGSIGQLDEVNDPEGRFYTKTYATGDHTALFRARGYASRVMALSAPAADVTIQMTLVAPVEGTVVDPWGSPVAGTLIIDGAPRGYHIPHSDEACVLARSGSDGTFRLEETLPVFEVISACHENYGPGSANVVLSPSAVTPVTIQLAPMRMIEGAVRFGGQAVELRSGVELIVRYDDVTIGYAGHLPIEDDGKYRVYRLQPGTVDVTVYLERYGSGRYPPWVQTKTVTLEDETVAEVDFEFPSGDASLVGTVFIDGEPALDSSIRVTYGVDDGVLEIKTDSEAGQYRLDSLPEGVATVDVLADSPDGEKLRRTFELDIDRGAVIEWDIELGDIE